ncbi:hypothetical protein [Nostoc sp. PCC 9305]|uniref:hypothetical protein n=1 Tax=Nostoc sp. PCC 9305 TaxID=296636 RepID=UPI0039C62F53
MSNTSALEGFISFRGHQVWYRIVKPDREYSGKLPLLCLHGDSGVPHEYLEPLEAIATTGRRVIFYEQLGCGNSDRHFSYPIANTIPILISEFLT